MFALSESQLSQPKPAPPRQSHCLDYHRAQGIAPQRGRKEVNNTFPNLLVEMKRKRCSQKNLAEHIGTSYSSLRNKLNGRNQFTLREMRAIQDFFADCSLDYLFTEHNTKE